MADFRTIWISDVHLGTKGCQAEALLSFLTNNQSEYLILVGDIIDFWALSRSVYWPASHNAVVRKILSKAKKGTKVIFIPGNHDENIREYGGMDLGEIEIRNQYIHTLVDGRKVLCIHGDEFDIVTRYHRWIAVMGDIGYSVLLWLNRHLAKVRSKMGMGYWSLSNFIKHKVKQAVNFIGDFEHNVAKEAEKQHVNVVVCGHIHHAEIAQYDQILYVNSGDWVESCTAIVESSDGSLAAVEYRDGQLKTIIQHDVVSSTTQRIL
jgi:UDP-2,3-diacylglucosamine pyrophosphatase LpxH